MILIAFGANLPSPAGAPHQTFAALMRQLPQMGITPLACSALYRSRAVGEAEGWFVNGVLRAEAFCQPETLMARLHRIEAIHRRQRPYFHAPRPLDLDLIDYHGRVMRPPTGDSRNRAGLILPHPHAHERIFVLLPLCDVAPNWQHPQSGLSLRQMLLPLRQSGEISR